MAVFTLSSLAAGLAGSGGALIASRAVQGVGAALSLFALTYALIEGSVSGWTAPLILGALAVAVGAAAAFVAIEARTANPMAGDGALKKTPMGLAGSSRPGPFGLFGMISRAAGLARS